MMKEIFLLVDFLCPLFFLLLARGKKGRERRRLIRESLVVLVAALLFAPIVALYYPLAVQGALTALILMSQMVLTFSAIRKKDPSA